MENSLNYKNIFEALNLILEKDLAQLHYYDHSDHECEALWYNGFGDTYFEPLLKPFTKLTALLWYPTAQGQIYYFKPYNEKMQELEKNGFEPSEELLTFPHYELPDLSKSIKKIFYEQAYQVIFNYINSYKSQLSQIIDYFLVNAIIDQLNENKTREESIQFVIEHYPFNKIIKGVKEETGLDWFFKINPIPYPPAFWRIYHNFYEGLGNCSGDEDRYLKNFKNLCHYYLFHDEKE